MDSQSSYEAVLMTEADVSDADARGSAFHQLARHAAWVGLGLLSGALGVVLAIGLAILIRLLLPPSVVFAPGLIALMVTAVLAGLGVSWLLGQMAHSSRSGLAGDTPERDVQVIMVTSVFASLFQTLIFFM